MPSEKTLKAALKVSVREGSSNEMTCLRVVVSLLVLKTGQLNALDCLATPS